jgi:GTP-binding protein
VGKTAEIYAISSTAHKGLTEVLRALRIKVDTARSIEHEINASDDEIPLISLTENQIADAWEVKKDPETGHLVVTGDKIEKFARRTNFDNFEGVNRLRDIMKKMGITHELVRAGAVGDTVIEIAGKEFTYLEQ